MFHTCKSATMKDSLARCRKMAKTDDGYCQLHAMPEQRWQLPEPGTILVRVQLTPELADIATTMGIRVAERAPERQQQLDESRQKEAVARYGQRIKSTGAGIFGTNWLNRVQLMDLHRLVELGFHLNDPHIVWSASTDLDHLVLPFTKARPELGKEGVHEFDFYITHLLWQTFDAKAYRNPPDLGRGGHEANYSLDCKIADGPPLGELYYTGEDWEVFKND